MPHHRWHCQLIASHCRLFYRSPKTGTASLSLSFFPKRRGPAHACNCTGECGVCVWH
jgi:hypothetical protein